MIKVVYTIVVVIIIIDIKMYLNILNILLGKNAIKFKTLTQKKGGSKEASFIIKIEL